MSFVSSSRAALRRLARDRSGASAMEMGIVMPVLFMFLFGTMEVARYVFTYQSLRSVTAEAARLSVTELANGGTTMNSAGVQPGGAAITSCTASSTINAAATKKTPFIDPSTSKLTLCIERTGTTDITIRVLAKYPFSSIMPYAPGLNSTIEDRTLIQYRVN